MNVSNSDLTVWEHRDPLPIKRDLDFHSCRSSLRWCRDAPTCSLLDVGDSLITNSNSLTVASGWLDLNHVIVRIIQLSLMFMRKCVTLSLFTNHVPLEIMFYLSRFNNPYFNNS